MKYRYRGVVRVTLHSAWTRPRACTNGGAVKWNDQEIVVPVDVGIYTFVNAVSIAFFETRKLAEKDWEPMRTAVMGADHMRMCPIRELEFSQPYVGEDIPAQLESYIDQCWERYCNAKVAKKLVYPYTTIVQSFGKSRLLRELAERTQAADSRMKVLYVCVREGRSSGYPVRTKLCSEYLFQLAGNGKPDDELERGLSSRLETVFRNAMLDWDSVWSDCLLHFLNNDHVYITHDKLTRKDSGAEDKLVQRSSHDESRILVLAVDEARWLMETDVYDQTGSFRRLPRALNRANDAIARTYGR